LLPLVYEELRKLATARMAQESAGQTLQATALVHEAWLRLVAEGDRTWQNRAQFFAAAAEAMRRILIDRARRKRAEKRGGGADRLSLDFPGAESALAEIASCDLRDLDRFFRDEMIRALFERAVDDLRRACEQSGNSTLFRVFERHDLAPAPDVSYASLARELDVTVSQVTNYLHAARRRFRELALSHLRSLCGTDEEFRLEARELFGMEVDS